MKPAGRRWLVWVVLFAAVTWMVLYLQPDHAMESSSGDRSTTLQ